MTLFKRIYGGRIGRGKFILGTLFFFLCFAVAAYLLSLLASALPGISGSGPAVFIFSLLEAVLYLAMVLVFVLPLWVRRLHDIGKSGWYMFIYVLVVALRPLSQSERLMNNIFFDIAGLLICVAYLIMFFILLLKRGDRGENPYGAKPLPGMKSFFEEIFNKQKKEAACCADDASCEVAPKEDNKIIK
jgi:uncharacterized membrane protein YhaH (DUF805 family)